MNIYPRPKSIGWPVQPATGRTMSSSCIMSVCLPICLSLSLFLLLFNSRTELPPSTFASNSDSEYASIFLGPHRLRSRYLHPIRFQQAELESRFRTTPEEVRWCNVEPTGCKSPTVRVSLITTCIWNVWRNNCKSMAALCRGREISQQVEPD